MHMWKYIKKYWIWILPLVMVSFIWDNSLTAGTSSGALSKAVAQWLLTGVEKTGFTIAFDTFHFYVRKLAHFSEYFALAILVCTASNLSPVIKKKRLQPLLFWFLVPTIDETIQLFVPGRCGALTDVCIDMTGFFFGSLMTYIIILIIRDLKHA